MAGLNVHDVVDVTIRGSMFGQLIMSKFYYTIITESTSNDVITACTSFAGAWKAGAVSPFLAFLACCPPQYMADQVTVQKVFPTRYVPGVNNVGLPGTDDKDSTSTNQASTITRSGQLSGRKFISTLHVPGLSQLNMVAGELTGGFKVKLGTLSSKILNDFADNLDGGTFARPVIYHRIRIPFEPVPPTNLFRAVAGTTARTMRRRTVGVGK